MRNRERGIGNLPFIAVLVLFVIAVALFFVKQDEADSERGLRLDAVDKAAKARALSTSVSTAYDALKDVVGLNDEDLRIDATKVPTEAAIQTAVRRWLHAQAQELRKAGEVTLETKYYQVADGKIIEQKGDTTTVRLYVPALALETWTVQGLLAPLPASMRAAAKIAKENNAKFDAAKKSYDADTVAAKNENASAAEKYKQDIAAKQQASEALKDELDKQRDSNTKLTAKLDTDASNMSSKTQAFEKRVRELERLVSAWKNRAIGEKKRNTLALKEDPSDGSLLSVSATLGTVWMNIGTKHKLGRGTKFTVWRPGKGNVRVNIAVVQVINVFKTSAEARIIRQIHSRVQPTEGMNVSNPFYDPKGTLKIFIYGDLRNYPTDIAARRLAASGAIVSRTLDDTVNVIVLGEPPRAGDDVAPEDEAEAAAAEKKAAMDRDRRLTVVMDKAIAIGAVVVTESVLATFIDY